MGNNEREAELREDGITLIAGVDETGKGAWAGPVVAAAVILPDRFERGKIRDSKAMKNEGTREGEYRRILAEALAISVDWNSHREIDAASERGEYNTIHEDLLLRTIASLRPPPQFVLIDSVDLPELGIRHESFDKGESLSLSIAAASVVARVTRDRIMRDLDVLFPGYAFAQQKGYGGGDGAHQRALDEIGPSPVHRFSTSVVKASVQQGTS